MADFQALQKGANDAIHVVSAFAARQRLVLGQTKVDEKSNEIVAIPKLLTMLRLEGAIVTIDAMGCQKESPTDCEQKCGLRSGAEGHQGALREDVELFAAEQKDNGFKDTAVSRHELWTAIMAASRPAHIRCCTISPGFRSGTIGWG